MVKVGITGVGGYGRVLLDLLLEEQRLGDVCVEAVVSRFPEQDAAHLEFLAKQSPATKIFASLDEAAESGIDLDLMVLPVGIGAHKELTVKSLEAGWNVMVEKPLAGSVEEAKAIVSAAEASDCFVAVGYQDMYTSSTLEMKRALMDGAIGEIKSVRALGIWGRPVEYYQRNEWAGRLVVGGRPVYDSPFNNGLAHYLNLALFLAGPDMKSPATPESVEGFMWRAHDIESCDTAALKWGTANDVSVSIFFSHASTGDVAPELLVEGSTGTLHWKSESYWEVGGTGRHLLPHASEVRRTMVRQVLQRVRDPHVPVYSSHQALAQVQAVELVHQKLKGRAFPESLIERTWKSEGGVVYGMVQVRDVELAGRGVLEGKTLRNATECLIGPDGDLRCLEK